MRLEKRAVGAPLDFEEAWWSENPDVPGGLVGVDEAGRGPLAGPVAAGAVAMDADAAHSLRAGALAGITDSKKLSEERREELFETLVRAPGVRWALGLATPREIDRLDILRATHLAMRRAVLALPGPAPAFAFVDGLPVVGLPCPHRAIVKGDAKSFLVAAASIVAKVSRDRIMRELDAEYPGYGFAVHKGYPTAAHLEALARLGVTAVHRRSFGPVRDVLNPPML